MRVDDDFPHPVLRTTLSRDGRGQDGGAFGFSNPNTGYRAVAGGTLAPVEQVLEHSKPLSFDEKRMTRRAVRILCGIAREIAGINKLQPSL